MVIAQVKVFLRAFQRAIAPQHHILAQGLADCAVIGVAFCIVLNEHRAARLREHRADIARQPGSRRSHALIGLHEDVFGAVEQRVINAHARVMGQVQHHAIAVDEAAQLARVVLHIHQRCAIPGVHARAHIAALVGRKPDAEREQAILIGHGIGIIGLRFCGEQGQRLQQGSICQAVEACGVHIPFVVLREVDAVVGHTHEELVAIEGVPAEGACALAFQRARPQQAFRRQIIGVQHSAGGRLIVAAVQQQRAILGSRHRPHAHSRGLQRQRKGALIRQPGVHHQRFRASVKVQRRYRRILCQRHRRKQQRSYRQLLHGHISCITRLWWVL